MDGIDSGVTVNKRLVPPTAVSSYPKGEIIGIYGLLGGAIGGGLLVFSYMIVMSAIDGNFFRQELTDIFETLLYN